MRRVSGAVMGYRRSVGALRHGNGLEQAKVRIGPRSAGATRVRSSGVFVEGQEAAGGVLPGGIALGDSPFDRAPRVSAARGANTMSGLRSNLFAAQPRCSLCAPMLRNDMSMRRSRAAVMARLRDCLRHSFWFFTRLCEKVGEIRLQDEHISSLISPAWVKKAGMITRVHYDL